MRSMLPQSGCRRNDDQRVRRPYDSRRCTRIHPWYQQQHLGTRFQRRRLCLRFNRQRLPQCSHADPQSILRPSRRLVAGNVADQFRRRSDSTRSTTKFARLITTAATPPLADQRSTPHETIRKRGGTVFKWSAGRRGTLGGSFVLEKDGAGYRSRNAFNTVASIDDWSAPIMSEVGPDGNVWVLDWYNYIVQHNPTPNGFQTGKGAAYESDLRDKRFGRVYRLLVSRRESAPSHAMQLSRRVQCRPGPSTHER